MKAFPLKICSVLKHFTEFTHVYFYTLSHILHSTQKNAGTRFRFGLERLKIGKKKLLNWIIRCSRRLHNSGGVIEKIRR